MLCAHGFSLNDTPSATSPPYEAGQCGCTTIILMATVGGELDGCSKATRCRLVIDLRWRGEYLQSNPIQSNQTQPNPMLAKAKSIQSNPDHSIPIHPPPSPPQPTPLQPNSTQSNPSKLSQLNPTPPRPIPFNPETPRSCLLDRYDRSAYDSVRPIPCTQPNMQLRYLQCIPNGGWYAAISYPHGVVSGLCTLCG